MPPLPFDLVYARSLNYGIGIRNAIPWNIPAELKMFKKITCSGPNVNSVIMGRRTFESIGKALPNRLNIVVSQSRKIEETPYLKQARSLSEALSLSKVEAPKGTPYVIGGTRLLEEGLADCRYIYETLVCNEFESDTFAPKHSLPCAFVSKSQRFQNLTYDYRLFYNSTYYSKPHQDDIIYQLPEHQELQYIRMIENIIREGDDKVDRTKTGTRALFGGMMRYDLSQTFPILTHKRVFWRGVAEGLLWFVSGSTDARLLE